MRRELDGFVAEVLAAAREQDFSPDQLRRVMVELNDARAVVRALLHDGP